MTEEQEQEYLASGGTRCPFCKSEDISTVDQVQVYGNGGSQDVVCKKCDKRWSDIYSLIGATEEGQ